MADLTTEYAGLTLKSPIVVASAAITETVERMRKCQENGAGAVVMKSYFEGEISRKSPTPRFKIIRHNMGGHKTFSLFSYEQASGWDIHRYAQEVSAAKSKLHIKIIPSIDCITDEAWVECAKILEAAGADALELNTSCPHGSITFRGKAVEETILKVVRLVRKSVSLPIIVKISPMVTSPIALVKGFEEIGAQGTTIFNRMTGLDIEIEEGIPIMHGGYAGHGGPWAIQYPLRWISEIRPQVKIDIAGSGGVSTWEDVVKYILAGANVVQTCTAVIMGGYVVIGELLRGLEGFMDRKGYASVDDFRGKASTRVLGTHEIDRRRRFRASISHDDHIAPCMSACPAHVPAQAYTRLIAQRRFAEAAAVIRSVNPFQSICGYVCYHLCEDECTRGLVDRPIAIRALKRFALEWAEKEGQSPLGNDVPTMQASGHKVAIVGAGPAGLTAAHDLVRMGHEVTVFEAASVGGGMLRNGIPERKLPREVLDREIAYIESVGVRIKLGSALGGDFTLSDLRERGFEAILVAIGGKKSRRLAAEDEDLGKVISTLVGEGLKVTGQGIIVVDEGTGATNADGIFAAGDAIHSAGRSLIRAIADGKRAATRIHRYMQGESLDPIPEPTAVDKSAALIRSLQEQGSPLIEFSTTDLSKRKSISDSMERTLTEEEAVREASRCLACGCGVGCDRCYQVCIYSAVKLVGDRYVISAEDCDGCGLCVEICPKEALSMVPVETDREE